MAHEDPQTRCDDPHFAGERVEACKAKHFTSKQGEEFRHPNQALLTQVLCAHPCLVLHNFSLVCWKVVHSLVNYAHGGVTGPPFPGSSGWPMPGTAPKASAPRSRLILILPGAHTGLLHLVPTQLSPFSSESPLVPALLLGLSVS